MKTYPIYTQYYIVYKINLSLTTHTEPPPRPTCCGLTIPRHIRQTLATSVVLQFGCRLMNFLKRKQIYIFIYTLCAMIIFTLCSIAQIRLCVVLVQYVCISLTISPLSLSLSLSYNYCIYTYIHTYIHESNTKTMTCPIL